MDCCCTSPCGGPCTRDHRVRALNMNALAISRGVYCVSHLITSKSSLMTIFILTIKTPRLLEIGDRIPGYNLSMISESLKCVLREWVEKSPCQISNFYLLSSKQGCQIVHQSRHMPPEEQRRRQVSSDWYLPCSSFEAAKGTYHQRDDATTPM
jgi:hypothetical protein